MQEMSEQIAQLKALLEREQQENKWIREANNVLEEKNKKLVEALEYYAGKNAWYLQKDLVTGAEVRRSIEYADTESGSRIDDAGNNILVINGGKRARTALEENEK